MTGAWADLKEVLFWFAVVGALVGAGAVMGWLSGRDRQPAPPLIVDGVSVTPEQARELHRLHHVIVDAIQRGALDEADAAQDAYVEYHRSIAFTREAA